METVIFVFRMNYDPYIPSPSSQSPRVYDIPLVAEVAPDFSAPRIKMEQQTAIPNHSPQAGWTPHTLQPFPSLQVP